MKRINHLGPLAVILITFLLSVVSSQSKADANQPSLVEDFQSGDLPQLATDLKDKLPNGKLKCVVDTYMKIVNPSAYKSVADVSKDNEGMIGYFGNLFVQNSCLGENASHFFENLGPDVDSSRISLAFNAGESANSSVKVGSIWQKVLHENSQDPEMAITILAICAASQKDIPYSLTPEQAEAHCRKAIKSDQDLKDVAQESLRRVGQNKSFEKEVQLINEWIQQIDQNISMLQEAIRKKDFPKSTSVDCPLSIYIPKVLGQNTDISDGLKKKIIRIYNQDPSKIDAKLYHVIDAAYIGCRLSMDCGLSPSEAGLLEDRSAAAYRTISLCPDIQDRLARQEALTKATGKSFEKITSADLLKSPEVTKKLIAQGQGGLLLTVIEISKIQDPGIRQEQFDSLWADLDAAYLYKKWYLGGGQIYGHNIPCTDIRTGGPKDLMQADLSRPAFNLCGVPGWTKKRCAKARSQVAYWDVDFEWTEAQHKLGAKFGAQQCADYKPKISLNDRACKYLKKAIDPSGYGDNKPSSGVQ